MVTSQVPRRNRHDLLRSKSRITSATANASEIKGIPSKLARKVTINTLDPNPNPISIVIGAKVVVTAAGIEIDLR